MMRRDIHARQNFTILEKKNYIKKLETLRESLPAQFSRQEQSAKKREKERDGEICRAAGGSGEG